MLWKFLSDNFSFFGRRNRKQYIVASIVWTIAGIPFLYIGIPIIYALEMERYVSDEEKFVLFIVQVILLAGLLCWTSNLARRLRDIGLGSIVVIPLMGLMMYLWGNQVYSVWAGVFMAAMFFLPMFIPSWDREHGLTHISAVLRRIAMVDGEISDAERGMMEQLCKEPFGMPDHVKERTMRDFNSGHQDTVTIDRHVATFIKKYGKNEDIRSDFARMCWMMANANGRPTKARADLAKRVSSLLGVEENQFRDPAYAQRSRREADADNNAGQGILPEPVKNLVGLIAKMAKADGVVKRSEIELISEFFEYGMRLPIEMRKEAIEYFGQVKSNDKTYRHYANLCVMDVVRQGDPEEIKHGIFELLLAIATADGEVHESEAEILEYMAKKFDISGGFDNYENHYSDAGEDPSDASSSQRKDAECYESILHIGPDASAEEIKKAYRSVVQSNHPDKVQHMSKTIQDFASEQVRLANEALEYFKRSGRV